MTTNEQRLTVVLAIVLLIASVAVAVHAASFRHDRARLHALDRYSDSLLGRVEYMHRQMDILERRLSYLVGEDIAYEEAP